MKIEVGRREFVVALGIVAASWPPQTVHARGEGKARVPPWAKRNL